MLVSKLGKNPSKRENPKKSSLLMESSNETKKDPNLIPNHPPSTNSTLQRDFPIVSKSNQVK